MKQECETENSKEIKGKIMFRDIFLARNKSTIKGKPNRDSKSRIEEVIS